MEETTIEQAQVAALVADTRLKNAQAELIEAQALEIRIRIGETQ